MTKLTNLIFKNAKHYLTSPFGYRKSFSTKAGSTSNYHSGADYGTNAKKIPQYAVEDGTILRAGTDGYGGKYAWIKYPRLNVKMLHYHLDSIVVKTGQKVTKGTLIGKTGMSGRATGIHLHLGIVNLANGQYLDPEKYNYTEPPKNEDRKNFLPAKGYYGYGDKDANVGKIASFMYKTFPAYTSRNALGNYYGAHIRASIKEFQRRCKKEKLYNDKIDGNTGKKTLKCLEHFGFKY